MDGVVSLLRQESSESAGDKPGSNLTIVCVHMEVLLTTLAERDRPALYLINSRAF